LTTSTAVFSWPSNNKERGAGGKKDRLNAAEIVGIVAGILGVIVGGVAAWYTWKAYKQSTERQRARSNNNDTETLPAQLEEPISATNQWR
jgi:hypothetical protein